jgi:hypothetical protein
LALCVWLAACGPQPAAAPPAVPETRALCPGGADYDGDGISDADEGRAANVDTDHDGIPDWQDADSDGDGIADAVEAGDSDPCTPPRDADGDGIPDFRDLDSDGNGIPDRVEGGVVDTDHDGVPDFADLDDDDDGIADRLELAPDPAHPPDTDGDGVPDYHDLDSDGDGILDRDEGGGDQDRDGVPNFRDLDSDGDCVPDRAEAGDVDPRTPPVDTDRDGFADFLDTDSDADGIPDSAEDRNCNGVRDGVETDRVRADSDGDGATDLVERTAGTDPLDPGSSPQARGDLVFVVAFGRPPMPQSGALDFTTRIVRADVVFNIDTTESMGGEIANLRASLGDVVARVRAAVPDTAFAVAGFRDYPLEVLGDRFGNVTDVPFHLYQRVTLDLGAVTQAASALTAAGGADEPEAQLAALHALATGARLSWSTGSVPAFAPNVGLVAGVADGTLGGAGFRAGAMPIIVTASDAPFHTADAYAQAGIQLPDKAGVAAELERLSARAIGISSAGALTPGGAASAHADLVDMAVGTAAVVPKVAFGAECGAGQCCTGIGGAGEAPLADGSCPLVFRVAADGTGLGDGVARAIQTLVGYAPIAITARAQAEPTADARGVTIDVVAAFVAALRADAQAGAPCTSGLSAVDRAPPGDGVPDTFVGVTPGSRVCFDLVPRINRAVPAALGAQVFVAEVSVLGDGVTPLATHKVYFLVPAVQGQPIVE